MKGIWNIEVVKENDNFISVDGVLFTKDMKQLIRYPEKNTSTIYIIPSDVEIIYENAFLKAQYLEMIIFPSKIKTVGAWSIQMTNLKTIIYASTTTQTNVNIRMDEQLKKDFDKFCEDIIVPTLYFLYKVNISSVALHTNGGNSSIYKKWGSRR